LLVVVVVVVMVVIVVGVASALLVGEDEARSATISGAKRAARIVVLARTSKQAVVRREGYTGM
jgi:hypothetical protein